MQLERLNSIVFAVVVFCVVGVIFLAASVITTLLVGLHFNALSIFGSSYSGAETLLDLLLFILVAISLTGAYLVARKAYQAVLRHEIAQEVVALEIEADHGAEITQTYDGPTKGPSGGGHLSPCRPPAACASQSPTTR